MVGLTGSRSGKALTLAVGVAVAGCAASTTPAAEVTATRASLDLGGRCARYRDADFIRLRADLVEARLYRGEASAPTRDTERYAYLRLALVEGLEVAGTRRADGLLRWTPAGGVFEPAPGSALDDLYLYVETPFARLEEEEDRDIAVEGTLTVEPSGAATLSLTLDGYVPPVQPGCGGGGELTLQLQLTS